MHEARMNSEIENVGMKYDPHPRSVPHCYRIFSGLEGATRIVTVYLAILSVISHRPWFALGGAGEKCQAHLSARGRWGRMRTGWEN